MTEKEENVWPGLPNQKKRNASDNMQCRNGYALENLLTMNGSPEKYIDLNQEKREYQF